MNIPVQLESRLEALAQNTGRPVDMLVCEAIERYAEEEEHFLAAVDQGFAEAGRGEFIENDQVLRWLNERERS